jgi:hypothetical protein
MFSMREKNSVRYTTGMYPLNLTIWTIIHSSQNYHKATLQWHFCSLSYVGVKQIWRIKQYINPRICSYHKLRIRRDLHNCKPRNSLMYGCFGTLGLRDALYHRPCLASGTLQGITVSTWWVFRAPESDGSSSPSPNFSIGDGNHKIWMVHDRFAQITWSFRGHIWVPPSWKCSADWNP